MKPQYFSKFLRVLGAPWTPEVCKSKSLGEIMVVVSGRQTTDYVADCKSVIKTVRNVTNLTNKTTPMFWSPFTREGIQFAFFCTTGTLPLKCVLIDMEMFKICYHLRP